MIETENVISRHPSELNEKARQGFCDCGHSAVVHTGNGHGSCLLCGWPESVCGCFNWVGFVPPKVSS